MKGAGSASCWPSRVTPRSSIASSSAACTLGGERFRKQRFACARHALEQDMALGDESDCAQADRLLLADDGLDELLAQAGVEIGRGHGRAGGHQATLAAETGWAIRCSRCAAFKSSGSLAAEG